MFERNRMRIRMGMRMRIRKRKEVGSAAQRTQIILLLNNS